LRKEINGGLVMENINDFAKWLEKEKEREESRYDDLARDTPYDDLGDWYGIGYADACIEILGKLNMVTKG